MKYQLLLTISRIEKNRPETPAPTPIINKKIASI